MKLRRTLATVAAAAAVVPAALLSATAAYADGATPSPGTTAPAAGTPAPTTSASTSVGGAAPSPKQPDSAKPSAPTTTPTPSASAQQTGPAGCTDPIEGNGEPQFDENLTTSFSGLPSKIVAGSGWHGFKLNVDNTSDKAYKNVDLIVLAAAVKGHDFEPDTSHLKLQFLDPDSGNWETIALGMNDEDPGYLASTAVEAHESFSIDLRLSVDASAPAGSGFAFSMGWYTNDKGECVSTAGDKAFYEFQILKAATQPGKVEDAKPQGGKKPLPVKKPSGDRRITPNGDLASTGSSSALPAIALAGGAAVAVGAGAVFIVRRRKQGAAS